MTYFDGQDVPAHKDTIMVHCLATSKSWGQSKSAAKMMEIVTRWHTKERGWRSVGYAAIIAYNGTHALGRDLDGDGNVLEEPAAAARGWNTKAIHLALAGGRGSSEHDNFSDHYTPEQDQALRGMIAEIERIAGRKMNVIGHNQAAKKACPGFHVPTWFGSRASPKMPAQPRPDPLPTSTPDKPRSLFAALLALFGGRK